MSDIPLLLCCPFRAGPGSAGRSSMSPSAKSTLAPKSSLDVRVLADERRRRLENTALLPGSIRRQSTVQPESDSKGLTEVSYFVPARFARAYDIVLVSESERVGRTPLEKLE
jgi:hypothetical protein